MDHAHLLRALHRDGIQRAVPHEPRQGSDRLVRGVRPPDADRVRPGLAAGPRRGRQGRRADQSPRGHAHVARRHSSGADEHVDDDQRHRPVAARLVRRQRRGAGRRARRAARHDTERHRQGVPLAGDIHSPARTVPPPDGRHGGVVLGQCPVVEPDQRLLLPPAGGRCHARAGAGVLVGDGRRRARRRP